MGLFILDKNQKLIKYIPSKGLHSLVQEEEINKMDTLRAEVDLQEWISIKDLELSGKVSFYMAVNDPYIKDDIHVYKISTEKELLDRVELTGINFAYDELKSRRTVTGITKDNYSTRELLEFTAGSYGWEIGDVDSDFPNFDIDIEYVSHLEVIQYLIEQTGGEIRFSSKLVDGKISNKRIDFVKEMSNFKGRRFVLGTNLLDVVKEEDESELYTAMVGTGSTYKVNEDDPDSEEKTLTFADVEWSKDRGDPVDKPLGQTYVEIPEATERFGYANNSPRIGRINFSSETIPYNILVMTYNELLNASRPKKQFSATVDTIGEDMELGETVAIIKPDSDFRYKTRIFKIKRDYLDNNNTEVEFGDRLIKSQAERLKTVKIDIVDELKDGLGSSGSGGAGSMREIKNVPVVHTVFFPNDVVEPSNKIDAYVDGYVQEFRHSRRPEFSHPLNPDVPDGEYIEEAHTPPTWAPKPDYGGYGTEGPKVIKYLYANDGRIYISWNNMKKFYITSDFLDVFQATHGYYPRDKTGPCIHGYVLAKDKNFEGNIDGEFRFVQYRDNMLHCVEIPKTIKGITPKTYHRLFNNSIQLAGVKNTNNTVTDMSYMFFSSSILYVRNTLDLSEFDTTGVLDMNNMFGYVFYHTGSGSLILDNFDTSQVTNMAAMFFYVNVIGLDLGSFNTSQVTNMMSMFEGVRASTINLNYFDTSNVTLMGRMFSNATIDTLDLSGFDTSSVTDMRSMFEGGSFGTLDLSGFDMSLIEETRHMLYRTEFDIGYARTQEDADILNDASVTGIPDHLTFVVKGG